MRIPTAADLMRRDISLARPDMTLTELASFLDDENVHGAPVVDDNGKLLGIVSRTDLVRALNEQGEEESADSATAAATIRTGDSGGEEEEEDLPAPDVERNVRTTARDIMTTDVVSAPSTVTAGQLADLMQKHEIHRIVIMTDGRVSGLVSVSDLMPILVGYERAIANVKAKPVAAGQRTTRKAVGGRRAVKRAARAPRKTGRKVARNVARKVARKPGRKPGRRGRR